MPGLQSIPGCCCGECKEHTCECCQCACTCICFTVTLAGTGTGSGVYPETVCWNATLNGWKGEIASLNGTEVSVYIRRESNGLCYLYLDLGTCHSGTAVYKGLIAPSRNCNPNMTFTGVDISGCSSTHTVADISIVCQRRVELSPTCACAAMCFGRVHLEALLVSVAQPADCTQAITLELVEGSDPPCWYWPGPVNMASNLPPEDPGTALWSYAEMLGEWVLITNNCEGDCTPVSPVGPGSDGELRETTCSCPSVDCGDCESTGTADDDGISICCVPESESTGTGTGTVGSLPLLQRYKINGEYFDTLVCDPETAPMGSKLSLVVGDCEVSVILNGWADCNL